MTTFTRHTVQTAPEGSKPILEGAQKALGFIPNLYAYFAESPAILTAYKQLGGLVEQTSFTAEEQQLILIAASIENRCEYCVAAHSFIAKNMAKVPAATVETVRTAGTLESSKLNALVEFTKTVVKERGFVLGSEALEAFYLHGYTQKHALEVILAVAMKTISNYTNHLVGTQLDSPFQGEAWKAPCSSKTCGH